MPSTTTLPLTPTPSLPLTRKLALDDNYITGDGLAGFAAAMMAPSLPDAVWALPALEMLDLDGKA